MIPETTTSLEQRIFLKGYQKLVIHPDGDLEVSFKRFSFHRQFRVPLHQINHKSERHKFLSMGSLAGLIFFLILSGFLTWGVIACSISKADRDIGFILLIPLLLVVVFAGVCLAKYREQSVDAIVFFLREGGQIHVWFEQPDAASFNAFCQMLTKKCQDAWNNRPVDPSVQSIAGEIVALKNLHDRGVLSDAEFERAKAKLIDQNGIKEKKIGFAQ